MAKSKKDPINETKLYLGEVMYLGQTVYFIAATEHRWSDVKVSIDYEIISGEVISIGHGDVDECLKKVCVKVDGMFKDKFHYVKPSDLFSDKSLAEYKLRERLQ